MFRKVCDRDGLKYKKDQNFKILNMVNMKIKIPNKSFKYYLQSFNEKESVIQYNTYPKKYFGEHKPVSSPPQRKVYGQWADSFV